MANAYAADIQYRLSGGASNTSASASLGGAMSTAGGGLIVGQTFTASTISGVAYNGGNYNTPGVGTATYTASGTTLQWTAPGGSIGIGVDIGTSGTYTVYSADGKACLNVTSVSASLPGGNASQAVTVANNTQAVFADIPFSEAVAGSVKYRCIYIKNGNASVTMNNFLLWIAADTVGADTLAIGLDPAGKNGTATTIANENTAPVGVTFTSPASAAAGLALGNLAAGEYYAVWLRRTVAAGTENSKQLADASMLGVQFA